MNTFKEHVRSNLSESRASFFVYLAVNMITICFAILSIIRSNPGHFFLCLTSIGLYTLPTLIPTIFRMYVPPLFRAILYLFILSSQTLGELAHFYIYVPFWDTSLHILSGFLCAAYGLALVYLLNRDKKIELNIFFLLLASMGITMLIAAGWEIFEFSMDHFGLFDMQKDYIVPQISSVKLGLTEQGEPLRIFNISRTIVETADGRSIVIDGGYLDIGITDTMKDLINNFLGGFAFCILAFLALKKHKPIKILSQLIITPSEWHDKRHRSY
ncbi:MAG: hypothetical protein KHZ87_01030 [Clostridiales bacterium]|nr:hypothetical protein [Clostridiales bacterium]MBS5877364.1 hypothetical protein [Clostridiales bacterium]MDU0939206.1 hypothetical protein [Clostridiales bacterium]MDU1042149.1 hypothetical protein [Clostridiales bacterium]MDU3490431.1 hypothetical protein [Clostridiales bacterium]